MNKKSMEKLKAIADKTRCAILELLQDGSAPVSIIKKKVKCESTLLSHHLKILRDNKLVESTRHGKLVTYNMMNTNGQDAFSIQKGCGGHLVLRIK